MNRNHTARSTGFSLVEAIVVAAIVAVLAAVAIPVYSGFLHDSRQRAVDELAQSAAAAADGYFRKTNVPPTSVEDLNLFYDKNKFTVEVTDTKVKVTMDSHVKEITYK